MTPEESKNSLQRQTLYEFAEMQYEMITANLSDEENAPMFIFVSGDGQLNIGVVPQYGNQALKSELRQTMQKALKAANAIRYAFIMEAWVVSRKLDEDTEDVLPSEEADRKEAITLLACDVTGEKKIIMAWVTRDENGKRVATRAVDGQDGPGNFVDGPLGNLFEGIVPKTKQ